jgi:transposase
MRSTAAPHRGCVTRLPELRAADEAVQRDLWKLRAALILLGAQRGSKLAAAHGCVAEFKATGLKVSIRSVYRWRDRYLQSGFAGIARKCRSDRGCPRQHAEEFLIRIIEAANRVRWHGDIRREFRRLKPAIGYEQFRTWIHRAQAWLRLNEAAKRGADRGLLF